MNATPIKNSKKSVPMASFVEIFSPIKAAIENKKLKEEIEQVEKKS